MKGTIKYVRYEPQYRFLGVVVAEDETTYSFNSTNWINRDLQLEDIEAGQEVEFELRPPNSVGKVYPKLLRFAGEEIPVQPEENVFTVQHSFGDFKSFVYIRTGALIPAFTQLMDDFDSAFSSTTALFRHLAIHYNALKDEDFIFEEEEGEPVMSFPSGLTDRDGNPIYLYCVKNDPEQSVEWFCDRLKIGTHVTGESVFDIVNANWYDVEADIKELVPSVTEDATSIIRKIEIRCIDPESVLVYLRAGQVCAPAEADCILFPSGYYHENGKELYLSNTQRSGVKGFGWYYDCLTFENAPLDMYDKKHWFSLWARNDSSDYLSELANMTLDEPWSFANRGDFGILRNYLIYTFAHQWTAGHIAFSSDGRYAAFNTGLPDRNTYKYIYAFYEKIGDETEHHPLWHAPSYRFRSFVIQGRGGDGKILSTTIRPLPNPPQYFKERSATVWELDFNDSNQVTMPEYDDIHILVHRCDRLPLEFYRYPAFRSERLTAILNDTCDTAEKYKAIREYFKPVIDNEPDAEVTSVYRLLSDALENVISTAVKKLSWNWRAVVPCYNPERDECCFLLPVSFCDPVKPDRAVIASSHKVDDETIYAIHTVIPMDWAYLDARLVCRPESEWLAADSIT